MPRDLFVLEHWTDWWSIERLGWASVEGTSEEIRSIASADRDTEEIPRGDG